MANAFSGKFQQKGSIYLWMLFTVTIAGILLAETGQVWQVKAQRQKEKELLLIGEQFRKAIMSYYNSAAASGEKKYPKSLEDLLLDKRGPVPQRHLRKIFIDPMTKSTEWGLVDEPMPEQENSSVSINRSDLGIIGVYSLSKQGPIKTDNFPEHFATFAEAATYQDWQFVYAQDSTSGSADKGKEQEQTASSPAASSSPFSPSGQATPSKSGSGFPSPGQGQATQNQPGGSPFQ